eukprot:scaffold313700_cov30-Tisochrysis_lutea.AAC.2
MISVAHPRGASQSPCTRWIAAGGGDPDERARAESVSFCEAIMDAALGSRATIYTAGACLARGPFR